MCGGETAASHAPLLGKQPFVVGMVHAGQHPGHAKLLLREECCDEVVLVVTGRGHDDIGGVELGLLEHPGLARVADHVIDLRGPLLGDLENRRVLFDERDVVTAVGQVRREMPSDRAGAADHDAQLSAPRSVA
jgi:hypothetical protein